MCVCVCERSMLNEKEKKITYILWEQKDQPKWKAVFLFKMLNNIRLSPWQPLLIYDCMPKPTNGTADCWRGEVQDSHTVFPESTYDIFEKKIIYSISSDIILGFESSSCKLFSNQLNLKLKIEPCQKINIEKNYSKNIAVFFSTVFLWICLMGNCLILCQMGYQEQEINILGS